MRAELTPGELAEERAAAAALREVLGTAAGRVWVAYQLRRLCGMFETSYLPGAERERRHTEFNEGRRFVALETLRLSGARLDILKQFEGKHGDRTEEGRTEEDRGKGVRQARRRRTQEGPGGQAGGGG